MPSFPVAGNHDGESFQTSPVNHAVRDTAQHAVGQMDGGEGRHQQMTDVPHIGIHIIDWFPG